MKHAIIIPTVVLAVLMTAGRCDAQSAGGQPVMPREKRSAARIPEVHARWFALAGDSIRVEYALPAATERPIVLVLSDRYGPQESLRSLLKVLAQLGYRAYAPPLLSAPEQGFAGVPAARVDSADIVRATRVAVDLLSAESDGARMYLLGFDVGANIAIELAARFPFFKGAALFYPSDTLALARLIDLQCPMQLHVPQFDTACGLDAVEGLRDVFAREGARLHVYFYKDARRFFFNPMHPDYHKLNTQKAWNHLNKQFRAP
ncbi:MAG: dienelactone hydrolase family protein [Bacteroidota bacterium]|jgi:dienelactone hydrolase|nr:dienelactone hydrolase family protein [Bacteroidota bacterium]